LGTASKRRNKAIAPYGLSRISLRSIRATLVAGIISCRAKPSSADRFHEKAQGIEIPCYRWKFPCSREKNSLFRPAQGIRVQRFENTAQIGTKIGVGAESGKIPC
jgi:hypothetical protein